LGAQGANVSSSTITDTDTLHIEAGRNYQLNLNHGTLTEGKAKYR